MKDVTEKIKGHRITNCGRCLYSNKILWFSLLLALILIKILPAETVAVINYAEFEKVASNWNQTSNDGEGDFILDGYVDIQDLLFIADNWLQVPGTCYRVNSLGDMVAEDGLLTLREAINASNRNAPTGDAVAGSISGGLDMIYFDTTLENGVIMLNGPLAITDNLIIIGPGANKLTVDGGWNGNIFSVHKADADNTVKISGLTLAHGKAEEYYGGCIYNTEFLTLCDVEITGNSTKETVYSLQGSYESSCGGGIYNTGSLCIDRCAIINNSIRIDLLSNSNGSGYCYGGGIYNSGILYLKNSTLSGNSMYIKKYAYSTGSRYGDGGGIYNAGQAYIYNCTIANGYAYTTGGGVFNNTGASLVMVSSIIADNDVSGPDSDNSDDLKNLSETFSASYCLVELAIGHNLLDSIDDNIIGHDAGLAQLGYWGGTTRSISLLPDSMAINHGSNPFCLSTDQRGSGYVRLSEGRVDIGAIEIQ